MRSRYAVLRDRIRASIEVAKEDGREPVFRIDRNGIIRTTATNKRLLNRRAVLRALDEKREQATAKVEELREQLEAQGVRDVETKEKESVAAYRQRFERRFRQLRN